MPLFRYKTPPNESLADATFSFDVNPDPQRFEAVTEPEPAPAPAESPKE